MNAPSDGGPAFPRFNGENNYPYHGMSLLAYFIAHSPPMPMSYRAHDDIAESQRVAMWRMDYANAQIALMEKQTTSPQPNPTP